MTEKGVFETLLVFSAMLLTVLASVTVGVFFGAQWGILTVTVIVAAFVARLLMLRKKIGGNDAE